MRRWFGLLLVMLILAAAIPLAGCGEGKSTYKIGALFSDTGFNSPLGKPEVKTAQMMQKKINANGGINGHPVKIITYDTQSDPAICYDLADKLINEDKVVAIIGPTGTGDTVKILDLVAGAGVPLVSCAAGTTLVVPDSSNDKHWVFQTPQTTLFVVQTLFDYLKSKDITNIGLITDTAGFGKDGLATINSQVAAYGITITDSETYATEDPDMKVQLQKIRDSTPQPQAVVCWGTNPGPATIAKNMGPEQLDMNIPLFCSHGIAFKEFFELAGEDANGVIFPCGKLTIVDYLPDSAQKDLLLQYREDYEAKYGEGQANTFGGHGYDALSMVIAALKNGVTETPDQIYESSDTLQTVRAKIREYIETKINSTGYAETGGFVGTGGIFNMSAANHNGLTKDCLVMVEIADGKWTPAD
jgi:branched-chain amino acid transport system substrate-binding protein